MRRLILPLLLAAAGCGEAVEDNHFANDVDEARPMAPPVSTGPVPVRIGELGPSFAACNGAGTTRNVAEGSALPVRAAPFDTAAETGRVPSGQDFYICSRSHDQKWFGIVYTADGSARQECGLSSPAPSRRDYDGACNSGWVASAFVRLTAGIDNRAALPPETTDEPSD